MTNEEAKRRIEICRDFLANNYSDMGEPNFTAFNMAIQTLSQEPKADKSKADKLCEVCGYRSGNLCVKPKDYICRVLSQEPTVDVLDKIRAEIEQLHYHPKLDFIKSDEVVDMALYIIDKYKAQAE